MKSFASGPIRPIQRPFRSSTAATMGFRGGTPQRVCAPSSSAHSNPDREKNHRRSGLERPLVGERRSAPGRHASPVGRATGRWDRPNRSGRLHVHVRRMVSNFARNVFTSVSVAKPWIGLIALYGRQTRRSTRRRLWVREARSGRSTRDYRVHGRSREVPLRESLAFPCGLSRHRSTGRSIPTRAHTVTPILDWHQQSGRVQILN